MYYGSNSAFLRSVTGRKLTLSSNYVSIRSVYFYMLLRTSHYIILDIFFIIDKSVCLKGFHGSEHLPPHPEHLCCPTKVFYLHRSHVHYSAYHHRHRQHYYSYKCCKNVPKSSSLHRIATIVINIVFSGAIILQNQFNADCASKIPI